MPAPVILIVDDDAEQLNLIPLMLAHLPYRIITVQSAARALEVLRDVMPVLILLDVAMPGTNGLDLSRAIRADARLVGMKIMAQTASPKWITSEYRVFVDHVLPKPFTKRQ